MNKYKWLALSLFISGLIAVISGASNPTAGWSIFLTSIGGAAIGSTIGSIFIRLGAEDLFINIRRMLSTSIKSKFTSEPHSCEQLKRKWYRYKTSMINGNYVWRCSIIDFSGDPSPNSLNTSISYENNSGKIVTYNVEGGVRGEHFVTFHSPSVGTESVAVEVIPYFNHSFESIFSGIIFHQNWDGENAISPVIISDIPLLDIKTTGNIPLSLNSKLNEIWIEKMQKFATVLHQKTSNFDIDWTENKAESKN